MKCKKVLLLVGAAILSVGMTVFAGDESIPTTGDKVETVSDNDSSAIPEDTYYILGEIKMYNNDVVYISEGELNE